MSARFFFFYGTLIAGSGNAHEIAAHAALGQGAAGRARGALYAIPDPCGWYPALVAGEGQVHGMVYPLTGPLDVAALDAYEGREYRRETIAVETGDDVIRAEAYLWAGALPPQAEPIVGGDFLAQARACQWRLFQG